MSAATHWGESAFLPDGRYRVERVDGGWRVLTQFDGPDTTTPEPTTADRDGLARAFFVLHQGEMRQRHPGFDFPDDEEPADHQWLYWVRYADAAIAHLAPRRLTREDVRLLIDEMADVRPVIPADDQPSQRMARIRRAEEDVVLARLAALGIPVEES